MMIRLLWFALFMLALCGCGTTPQEGGYKVDPDSFRAEYERQINSPP
jgi:hypothetical protein